MKTKVINLYGGPGAGKSTTAMGLCAKLKRNKVEAELVKEYIKSFIWEKRAIMDSDQVYFLAKQHRSERIVYGKTDILVSEAPMWLMVTYEKSLTKGPYVCGDIIKKFVKESKDIAEHYHVFINRKFDYVPEGRYQTEEEAKVIDQTILKFLKDSNLPFIEVDAGDLAEDEIIQKLGLMKK